MTTPSRRACCFWQSLLHLLLSSLAFISTFLVAAGPQSPPVNLGTTLVAVSYRDGVVVGADTRTSVGTYVSNRYADKIAPILDNVVLCRSGSAADTQHLADEIKWIIQSRYFRYESQMLTTPSTVMNGRTEDGPLDVREDADWGLQQQRFPLTTLSQIAHLVRSLIRKEAESHGVMASILCAGFDRQIGKGRIFSIAPSGMLVEENGYAFSGSGSSFIVGLLDEQYRPDMDEEEAVSFVAQAIGHAMERDGSSGGFVRIHVMDKNGRRVRTVLPHHATEGRTNNASRLSLDGNDLKGFAAPIRHDNARTTTKSQ